LTATNWNQD